MSNILTFPSLHRMVRENCTVEEQMAFEDYKIQNNLQKGIRFKGDPKTIGQQIASWLEYHASKGSEYLSLANKIMEYFYEMRNCLLNNPYTRLEII